MKKIFTILDDCYHLKTFLGKSVLKFHKKVKQQYHHLAFTASSKGIVSLSACQLGFDTQMFVILNKGKLVNNKWKGYKVDIKDYDLYCNPRIDKFSVDEQESIEQCPSVPGVQCKIKRSKTIVACWTDKKDESIEKQFSGFQSILFQHEMNHIHGKLIVDRSICNGQIELLQSMKSLITEKDQFDIFRLKQSYKTFNNNEKQSQASQKYKQLLQQLKYSIIQKAAVKS